MGSSSRSHHYSYCLLHRSGNAHCLCRWIKLEQLFSSLTWWIHFHLVLVVSFLLCPFLTDQCRASRGRREVYILHSMAQSLNVNGKCGDDANDKPCMQRDNRSENVNNWCGSKRWSANTNDWNETVKPKQSKEKKARAPNRMQKKLLSRRASRKSMHT